MYETDYEMLRLQPGAVAHRDPERVAIVASESGGTITYATFERRSSQLANALRAAGLGPGDHVAVLMPNHERYLEVVWACQRSGIYWTPVNRQLTPDEVAYIFDDSGSRVVVSAGELADVAATAIAGASAVEHHWVIDPKSEPPADARDLDDVLAPHGSTPTAPEVEGLPMYYTSGTTGRPKGVVRPLSGSPTGTADVVAFLTDRAHLADRSVYLSPAPLCFSAPIAWALSALRRGATVVVMPRFDPVRTLELIESMRVTHALFVPTMFVRLLKLDETLRTSFDLSSLDRVVHVGAPCPPDVKRAMLAWWGLVVDEFYSGSEANGSTYISAEEWIERPGSVGRASSGVVHITGPDDKERSPGEIGTVRFSSHTEFHYHNDPAKTAAAHDSNGWATIGDIGYLDEDGYLYLTDRAGFMIITGGLNVYPAEVEAALTLHPAVFDVGVFGVPDVEFGEQVKAVVQPAPGYEGGPELERELLAACRERLAAYKCPRSIDFVEDMPRLDTGKLRKELLRQRYLMA